MITQRMFRNVNGAPTDPVATWHPEVFTAILSYGGIEDYDQLVEEIRRRPWGPAARTVDEILGYSDPDDEDEPVDRGTWRFFRGVIDHARQDRRDDEARQVASELASMVKRSGLTMAEFAARCGTSRTRLSSYVAGRVAPRGAFLVRARGVVHDAAGQPG